MFLKLTFIIAGKPQTSVPVNNALVSKANTTAVSEGVPKSVSNRTYSASWMPNPAIVNGIYIREQTGATMNTNLMILGDTNPKPTEIRCSANALATTESKINRDTLARTY
jgi:hypothetical protein